MRHVDHWSRSVIVTVAAPSIIEQALILDYLHREHPIATLKKRAVFWRQIDGGLRANLALYQCVRSSSNLDMNTMAEAIV